MTKYQCNFDHTKPFSDAGVKMLLAANTALPWTVPGSAKDIYRAVFSASSNSEVWVSLNGTATIPVANTATDTYNEEFLPSEPKYVKGGDVLSFISTATPQVGVSLLKVQEVA